MRNLFIVLIPTFIALAGLIYAIVYEIATHAKHCLFKTIVFGLFIVVLLVLDIPTYKDMIEKETITVVGEYKDFQSNSMPGTRHAFFKNKHFEFSVYVPMATRDIAKMKVGEIYEIEYFKNSKVIKSYRLIESEVE